jgi:hypothetical protein
MQFACGSMVLPFHCVPFPARSAGNGTPKKKGAMVRERVEGLPKAKHADCVSPVNECTEGDDSISESSPFDRIGQTQLRYCVSQRHVFACGSMVLAVLLCAVFPRSARKNRTLSEKECTAAPERRRSAAEGETRHLCKS